MTELTEYNYKRIIKIRQIYKSVFLLFTFRFLSFFIIFKYILHDHLIIVHLYDSSSIELAMHE